MLDQAHEHIVLHYRDINEHNDAYSATKAEGEALVIKSNGSNGLLTCCICPSSIFCPGDKLLVPSLVSAARAGKSKAYFVTNMAPMKHRHVPRLCVQVSDTCRTRTRVRHAVDTCPTLSLTCLLFFFEIF